MRVVECEQGTSIWKAARAGKVTASCTPDVMASGKTKGSESLTRRAYLTQLVAEILTGEPCDGEDFRSKWIDSGKDQEPLARAAYEVTRDIMVDQVGFVLHPTIERYGASPDGLIGDDGMIEAKCPKPSTHLAYFLAGVPPTEYHKQMLSGMDCCERRWCDFISYCPKFPAPIDLFVVRFMRDDNAISEIRTAVQKFNDDVDSILNRLPKP